MSAALAPAEAAAIVAAVATDPQAWECGLCGEPVTDALLDADLHACCGCGYRDAAADGRPGWTCPSCG